ncbi:SAC3_GANP domain-containing protein [Caenorhabditis elegans]|uniref:SAC3_GANP domain-containing protein n=1 Tax=Caenorhabditis elegans TaxID=6239 RepID=Q95QN0_CAEEL|nr:SAC3_GANP domain-containing protein [Caenorhabditis elegans]CCD65982.1 SAC3_GANP domain-containing protein [Caenorhabditis elegans]|eukprot:NP_871625.1 Uncharacterized protein CELE_F01F1.1 [Caenorhabditis elegans]
MGEEVMSIPVPMETGANSEAWKKANEALMKIQGGMSKGLNASNGNNNTEKDKGSEKG